MPEMVLSFEEACVVKSFAGFQAGALGDRGAAVGEMLEGCVGRGCREGLNGSAEGCSFGALHRDDGITEDVGEYLAPSGVFASAAGEPDFRGFESEGFHAAKAVGHAECDAFHRGPGHVGGCEVRGVHAVQDTTAFRKIWRALALEVRKEEESIGPCGNR